MCICMAGKVCLFASLVCVAGSLHRGVLATHPTCEPWAVALPLACTVGGLCRRWCAGSSLLWSFVLCADKVHLIDNGLWGSLSCASVLSDTPILISLAHELPVHAPLCMCKRCLCVWCACMAGQLPTNPPLTNRLPTATNSHCRAFFLLPPNVSLLVVGWFVSLLAGQLPVLFDGNPPHTGSDVLAARHHDAFLAVSEHRAGPLLLSGPCSVYFLSPSAVVSRVCARIVCGVWPVSGRAPSIVYDSSTT